MREEEDEIAGYGGPMSIRARIVASEAVKLRKSAGERDRTTKPMNGCIIRGKSASGAEIKSGSFHQEYSKRSRRRDEETPRVACAQTPGRNVPLRQRAGGGERIEARRHGV